MTMTTQTDEPLIGALLSIRRADTLLALIFILLQSWLFYMTYSESQRLHAERIRGEQRHQEIMESLRMSRLSEIRQQQHVTVEQSEGLLERETKRILKGGDDGL